MKTPSLLLFLFLFILFSSSKAQVLLINGHFLNSNNRRIKANYTLMRQGKVIHSGKDSEDVLFDVKLNEVYSLTVSQDGFKTKTIYFSVTPERFKDKYVFDFDVYLKEKYKLENIQESNHTIIEYNYNCSTSNSVIISNEAPSTGKPDSIEIRTKL